MYQRKQIKKQTSPRKLPPPPKSSLKYKDVSSVIDAGPNVRKRQAALAAVRQYYQVRPDELFRRLQPGTLVTLMVEVARLTLDGAPPPPPQLPAGHADTRPPSDLQSLVEGCGELSLSAGDAPAPPRAALSPAVDDQPYLLLDVRDRDDFRRGHITTARHYPAARLARTMSYETAEMWRYKRHAHAVIVLVDEDETLAQRCASTLVQRGYENLFILSGGLKMARDRFPHGLLSEGDKDQFTAEEVDALSATLDTYSVNADAQSAPASARSARSVRSVFSQQRAAGRARASTQAAAQTRPGWRL